MIVVAVFALAAGFSALLWLISARFRPLLSGRDRVIMQWSLSGKPTNWAPPRVALAVTPAVGTLSLLLLAALTAFATPAEGQGPMALGVALIGLLLAAIHTAHLWFAARSPER